MKKIGVIIGRFQVPYLHPGHVHLLEEVHKKCDIVLVLIGCADNYDSRNILPFDAVSYMVRQVLPECKTMPLFDMKDDQDWSEQVDSYIDVYKGWTDRVTLYGSRDCFSEHYHGGYPFEKIPELPGHSGTSIRDQIKFVHNEDFRRGIFYAFKHIKPSE